MSTDRLQHHGIDHLKKREVGNRNGLSSTQISIDAVLRTTFERDSRNGTEQF